MFSAFSLTDGWSNSEPNTVPNLEIDFAHNIQLAIDSEAPELNITLALSGALTSVNNYVLIISSFVFNSILSV